jgi:nucleoside-diphosphate-sugar epimerase
MANQIVLVTGSAGRIGRMTVAELQRLGVPVRAFDRVPTPGAKDGHVGQILDPNAIRKAMQGVQTLIHLAATPDDVDDPVTDLFPSNIVGVYHVFEAARAAGVMRLVLASSGQVVWYQRFDGPYPIHAESLPTPRAWYAATKCFLEAAGRAFHHQYGMEVIAVRLGWCPRDAEQIQQISTQEWAQEVYLSPRDAGRFFASTAIATGPFRYEVVYATSRPPWESKYDLEHTKRLFGYEGQETWPQGCDAEPSDV